MSQLEDNTELIEQREREIQSVVRSISEINEMYKDLATMVVEQVRNRRRERERERAGGRGREGGRKRRREREGGREGGRGRGREGGRGKRERESRMSNLRTSAVEKH